MELQDTALTSTTPESRYPDLVLQKGTIDADYQSRQGQVSAVTSPPINSEPTSNGRCRNCNKRTFGPCSCRSRTEEGNLNPGFRDKGHQFDPIRVKVEEVKLNELESMEKGPEIEFGRKWEYFPGKNKFYFNGRLMTAPSIRFCMLSFFLILVTFVLFTIFDGPFLAKELTIAIPIIGFVLFFLVMVNMFKTSCSDPGILPRASAQESEFIEKSYASAHGLRPPPRTKDIVVNGQTIKSKYCFTCKMFRPPRASHCGVCDNCVDRFDHHCPFLGNCIGKRNYRNFYTFIVSLSLLAVFVLSCSITHLALIGKEKGNFLDALRDSPTSAVVILISFFGMWTVIGLAGFHTYLIAVEQTTNEDIKGIFGRSNSVNPYTKGNVCHNCCFILCGPYQPSLIDSRGLVTPDFLASLPRKTGGNEISTSPHCSLPPGSMRAHCGDGPNTPRSGTNEMTGQPNMYQITALESGGTKSGVGTTNVISSTTQFPRASIPGHPVPSLPKAGTVPGKSKSYQQHLYLDSRSRCEGVPLLKQSQSVLGSDALIPPRKLSWNDPGRGPTRTGVLITNPTTRKSQSVSSFNNFGPGGKNSSRVVWSMNNKANSFLALEENNSNSKEAVKGQVRVIERRGSSAGIIPSDIPSTFSVLANNTNPRKSLTSRTGCQQVTNSINSVDMQAHVNFSKPSSSNNKSEGAWHEQENNV